MDAFRLHLLYDGTVALQSEDGAELFFCGGEAERSATDVVGSGFIVCPYVIERVGRTSDEEILSEDFPCFGYRHVVLAQVHSVGLQLAHQFHPVVDEESGSVRAAQFLYLQGHRFRLLVRGMLHAQLYPAASPFEGHPGRVEIRIRVGEMCDELQLEMIHVHGLILHKLL